jgi:hypothetical protein
MQVGKGSHKNRGRNKMNVNMNGGTAQKFEPITPG